MTVRPISVCLAIGVAVGVVGTRVDAGIAGLGVSFAVSILLATLVVRRWFMPHLFVEQLRKIHDRGGETPPAGSEPATPPIVAEWAEALNQGDLDRARALLAEEFRCESPQLGKTFRRDRYLRALRALHRLFPRVSYSVREVREAAGELWVRVEMEARPRRGDPIVADAWEAWRVEGGRILEIRQGRVLEVSP